MRRFPISSLFPFLSLFFYINFFPQSFFALLITELYTFGSKQSEKLDTYIPPHPQNYLSLYIVFSLNYAASGEWLHT